MDNKSDPDVSSKEVQDKLEHLSQSVNDLGELIHRITLEVLEDYLAKSDQIERAKVYHILAFMINALSFAHIKIRGRSVESHPVMSEIERLRRYYIRLYDGEKRDGGSVKKVNTRVASNIIKHSLSNETEFSDEIKMAREKNKMDSTKGI